MVATSSAQSERNIEIQMPNQAVSLINMLPEECVVEILSRLPPKPFFRCKSVCKSWFSLSSDAFHINKHLHPTLAGFFCNKLNEKATFVNLFHATDNVVDGKISALSRYDHLRILDCCNGLLLIEAFNMNAPLHDLHVYNPATQILLAAWSFILPSIHLMVNQAFSLACDTRAYSLIHIVHFTSQFQIDETYYNIMDIFSFKGGKCVRMKQLVYDTRTKFNSRALISMEECIV